MARLSGKSSSQGRFCFILALLAFLVILMCWDSFRRSAFIGLDATAIPKRASSDAECESVFVESQSGKSSSFLRFELGGQSIYSASLTEGMSVVTIDPKKQAAIAKRTYYASGGASTPNDNLVPDLTSLSPDQLVLIAASNFGHKLDASAVKALKGLGSSLTQDHPPKAYVLIGSTRGGGVAFAEGQGNSARALAVLPCMDEQQMMQPVYPRKQQRIELGNAPSEPIAQEVKIDKEDIDDATSSATEKSQDELEDAGQSAVISEGGRGGRGKEKDRDASNELKKPENEALVSDQPKVTSMKPPEQSKPKALMDEKKTEEVSERSVSPETKYRCVGSFDSRSCLFKNLYYYKGRFAMWVLKGPSESIEVKRANKYEGLWKPDIEVFSDIQKIEKKVQKKALIEERGLSVQFNPLFHNNIGHGIFDGLYPAFFATVKLEVQDRPWLPVVAVDPGCFEEGATGALMPGDWVEAYLPDSKYGRSLRASRVQIVRAPPPSAGEAQAKCKWQPGFDHNGLDMGGTAVGAASDPKAACYKACFMAFGCKAGVLFDNTCYLKGKGGGEFARGDRPGIKLCKIEGGGPKSNVIVKTKTDMSEVDIPDAWIVGKIRRRCMTEGIYEAFGGVGEIRRLFEMERDTRNYPDLLLRFEEIVFGVGGAGNMIADKSGAIAGSLAPHNAMSQFRDRMLRSYGLPVDKGVKPVPLERDLKVIVISNKRFHLRKEDGIAIDKVIQKLNDKGGFNAKLINWGAIGAPDNKFREHLKMTQKADVYVSSIGTALQYVPFMRDGKIFVALGSVWMRSGQYFPTFMEQQLAGGGTPYLRTLYADPGGLLRSTKSYPRLGEDGYFASINGTLLEELMQQAEVLLRKGFDIPVAPEENLSVEGKIIVEICKRDAQACKNIMHHRNGGHGMALLWNECVVYEVGPWRKGGACGNTHHKLLRQLRKEYGIPGYGAPEL